MHLDGRDGAVAAGLFAGALAVYLRTLAPDLLYGDSGELQALAAAPGLAHPGGYAVTVALLAGAAAVLPGPVAWCANVASALGGAAAVASMYVLARQATPNRLAAALVAGALGASGGLWSQAVIAEVYSIALAVGLAAWCLALAGHRRGGAAWLVAAGFLLGLSPGVHLANLLVAPALAWLAWRRGPAALATLGLGGALGVLAWAVVAAALDGTSSPVGYIEVVARPSASLWPGTQVDTSWARIGLLVAAPQWQAMALHPDLGALLLKQGAFWVRLVVLELPVVVLVAAALGWPRLRDRDPAVAESAAVAVFTVLFVVGLFTSADRHLLYLAAFPPALLLAAAGLAHAMARWPRHPVLWGLLVGQHFVVLGALACVAGRAPAGAATYAYPADLHAPRRTAEAAAAHVVDGTLVVARWRVLFPVWTVCRHERGLEMAIRESTPFGSQGRMAESLVDEIAAAVADGRRVVTDDAYPELARFEPRAVASGWFVIGP